MQNRQWTKRLTFSKNRSKLAKNYEGRAEYGKAC